MDLPLISNTGENGVWVGELQRALGSGPDLNVGDLTPILTEASHPVGEPTSLRRALPSAPSRRAMALPRRESLTPRPGLLCSARSAAEPTTAEIELPLLQVPLADEDVELANRLLGGTGLGVGRNQRRPDPWGSTPRTEPTIHMRNPLNIQRVRHNCVHDDGSAIAIGS